MTVDFYDKQIIEKEKITRQPYIGFFAPEGTLIDFNMRLGANTHTSYYNPVSYAFCDYVSYIVPGISIKNYKRTSTAKMFPNTVSRNEYIGIDNLVVRGCFIDYQGWNIVDIEFFLKNLNSAVHSFEASDINSFSDYEKFKYRILKFFQRAYQNKRFFESIGRDIWIEDPEVVKKRIKEEYRNCNLRESELEGIYLRNLRIQLLAHFKDICVQYLGYDSLERFNSKNLQEISIPDKREDYNFDFFHNPRIITTSCFNPNERYFNWLIRDYVVHQLPKYNYNELTRIYEPVLNMEPYHISHSEEIYGKEIASIRKLVPQNERYKYEIH